MDSIMEICTHEGTLSSRDGMQWAESSFSWLWRSKCPQWGKLVERRLNNQHTHSWNNSSCVWFNHVQLSVWCANAEMQYRVSTARLLNMSPSMWTSVHATYGSPHQHSWELEGFPEDSAEATYQQCGRERLLSPGDLPPATATICDPLISRFCCSQCLVDLVRLTEMININGVPVTNNVHCYLWHLETWPSTHFPWKPLLPSFMNTLTYVFAEALTTYRVECHNIQARTLTFKHDWTNTCYCLNIYNA